MEKNTGQGYRRYEEYRGVTGWIVFSRKKIRGKTEGKMEKKMSEHRAMNFYEKILPRELPPPRAKGEI